MEAEMRRSEKQMSSAVAEHLRHSAREVRVADCAFDVVSYDKPRRLFRLVECKLGSKAVDIGHAFGQIAAYYSVLSENGFTFLDNFGRKMPMRFGRWMEAIEDGKHIRVEFYVALTDKACERVDLLRSIKRLLPDVGIIRLNARWRCRHNIRDEQGKRDYELAHAKPMLIKILQPARSPKRTE
jgi:hypothetical protein